MNSIEKRIHEVVKLESSKNDLSISAIMALVEIESAFDPWAIRKEPINKWIFRPGQYARQNHITITTETELQHFSFGLMQIMGSTARAPLNYDGNLLKLLGVEMNLHYGIKYLCWIKKRFKISCWEAIASAFNAGSPRMVDGKYVNQIYVDKFKSARRRWEQQLNWS